MLIMTCKLGFLGIIQTVTITSLAAHLTTQQVWPYYGDAALKKKAIQISTTHKLSALPPTKIQLLLS